MANNTPLALLRNKMQQNQLDYYLVGSSDPHNDEYVPEHWRYLLHVSGFSGSLGYLLASRDFAGLWVDSRYHIQAEREAAEQIQVFRIGKPGVPLLHEYWQQCLTTGGKQLRLGFDGRCFSQNSLSKILPVCRAFGCQTEGEALSTDELWPEDLPMHKRPGRPESPVYSYALKYCGQSRQSKVEQVRKLMDDAGYDYYPIPLLDNIAWLLNARSADIAYNPVAISYLMLGKRSLCWYIEEQRITNELASELQRELPELEIRPYGDFYSDAQALKQREPDAKFLMSERCNMRLLDILSPKNPSEQRIGSHSTGRDIITDLKAIKNETEQAQLRKVMAIDGAAMLRFHYWLRVQNSAKPSKKPGEKSTGPQQSRTEALNAAEQSELNEYLLGEKVEQFRSQTAAELGKGESFAPIVGFRENSALPHYSAAAQGSRRIERQGGWLLIDSGGQYLGGTTDMTRCFSLEEDFAAPRFGPMAEPSQELREIYTTVLRGHLRLQNARFPKGTLGVQLDTLARSPLWAGRLDYQHGTGHGVGNFLNVHEGPASLSPYPLNEPLKAGMLLSNEPGYYREGAFGFRIENLMLVQTDKENPNWLYFEPVSLFPYERELICCELMSKREISWVDAYHELCYARIVESGKLDEPQTAWLRGRCAPLTPIAQVAQNA